MAPSVAVRLPLLLVLIVTEQVSSEAIQEHVIVRPELIEHVRANSLLNLLDGTSFFTTVDYRDMF